MSRRSRRGKKSSSRNLYIVVTIAVILSAAILAAYLVETNGKTTNSSSSSTTSTSISGTGPYAVLNTSQGVIVVQLFPQVAPNTVSNFESLANSGFYKDIVWHRIVSGFVIQTGDPNSRGAVNSSRDTWGQGQGPYTEPLETNPNYHNDVGYVAIAHTSGSTSGGSEFYINLANNTSLDGSYTVFGKVVQGMDVVDKIAALQVYTNPNGFSYDQPVDAQSALLISVTIQDSP